MTTELFHIKLLDTRVCFKVCFHTFPLVCPYQRQDSLEMPHKAIALSKESCYEREIQVRYKLAYFSSKFQKWLLLFQACNTFYMNKKHVASFH